jgi:hypothetical protein
MRAGQELLKEEMLTKLEAHHEGMIASIDSQLQKMEASLGKMEANPGGKEYLSVHEVPKEEAAVETFGALKERHGDRHQSVRRRSQQWWTREEVGRRLQGDDPPCQSCTAKGSLLPGSILCQEPRKDGRSGRDVGRNLKASMKKGGQTYRSSYLSGSSGKP